MGSAGSPTRGCNCQRGVCGIQEARLGYKNDEKKDSLPDLWPFFSALRVSLLFLYNRSNAALFIGFRSSGSELYCWIPFLTR